MGLISGGWVSVDDSGSRVVFKVPKLLDPDELVHPYLVLPANVISMMKGRETYHAGAVGVRDGAVALLADREGGKSSTLAWLAQRGARILSDDLLVIDNGKVLPGPRCVDLREPAARMLGHSESLPSAREGGRWRVLVDAVPPLPLRGLVYLSWGPRLHARRLPARDRLDLIIKMGRPADPLAPLGLAQLPAWEIERPKDWSGLPEFSDLLFELGSSPRVL